MSETVLGNKPDTDAGRDAVHIGVFPAIAGEKLEPGQHVGFIEHDMFGYSDARVGIVDPFLTMPVETGEAFWLCLYPKSITSLKHSWVHPAFGPVPVSAESSRAWIDATAPQFKMTGAELLEAAKLHVDHGYKVSDDFAEWELPMGFWDHYEIVTGTKVPVEKRGNIFSCCGN